MPGASKPDVVYHIHNEKRKTAPKQNGDEEKYVKLSYKSNP